MICVLVVQEKNIRSVMGRNMQILELIQIAKDTIAKQYKKSTHTVGAAVFTKTGKCYTGISIKGQKLDLCSEWTAIGKAFTEGDGEITMAVAVHRDEEGNFNIYPPCSICRELYVTYAPEALIVLSPVDVVKASELLPHMWKRK